METFAKLFERFLVFVYHCFDRIAIRGYLPLLTPGQNTACIFPRRARAVSDHAASLGKTHVGTGGWGEGYARNHRIPTLDAKKGVSKEDTVRPHPQRMERRDQHGVYCIFTSMEMGSSFKSTMPPAQNLGNRFWPRLATWIACWACRMAAPNCTGDLRMWVFRVLLDNLRLSWESS
jgi:hypothetical protein